MTLLFPAIIIVLFGCASIVYFIYGDFWKGLYFASGAIINFSILML